jgi:hypothetical protein
MSNQKSDITVVLNGFRRGKNLNKQIKALENQSIKPDEIMLWYNNPGSIFKYNFSAIRKLTSAVSNSNFGVWARFYYALNAKTKYVCVFDDDTIPGERWLENCLNTIKTHRGLLGTIGLVFGSEYDYFKHVRYGWDNPNEDVRKVDIVGHSWFFEKEFLTAFCRELPLMDAKVFGEDIHFSYTLQKYMGLNTYVPPHPLDDKSMWGSLEGMELGLDDNAISRQHHVKKDHSFSLGVGDYFRACIKNGWKLVDTAHKIRKKTFKDDLCHIVDLLDQKIPFAFNRFSDGELFILQDKELVLGDGVVKVGDDVTQGVYKKEDHKHFNPSKHSFYRDRLVDSFKFEKENYFRGISCRCCVGQENFKWQKDFLKGCDKNLTWANLFLNANYPNFVNEIYPLFRKYKTVFVCNEKAYLSQMPFVVKDFRVGYNAMINDYGLIEEMKSWIKENDISGYLFLFAASSFSKMAIHQLYEFCDKNTYIDIGTSLNHLMDMGLDRSYLKEYWLGHSGADLTRECIW